MGSVRAGIAQLDIQRLRVHCDHGDFVEDGLLVDDIRPHSSGWPPRHGAKLTSFSACLPQGEATGSVVDPGNRQQDLCT